jgi:hypothetical protein
MQSCMFASLSHPITLGHGYQWAYGDKISVVPVKVNLIPSRISRIRLISFLISPPPTNWPPTRHEDAEEHARARSVDLSDRL